MGELKQDVSQINEASYVTGEVVGATQGSVVVVGTVFDHQGKRGLYTYRVLGATRQYRLGVPPAHGYVAAFEDRNRDFTYQIGEPFAATELPPPDERATPHLEHDLVLSPKHRPPWKQDGKHLSVAARAKESPIEAEASMIAGVIADLDEDRFSKKSGEDSLWIPVEFVREKRHGVFFLEPYDRERTLVLFVHGMAGSPADLRPLMESLDKKKFQVAFYNYPSGFRLSLVVDYLATAVRQLELEHRLGTIHVVAHSMGGLVSRAFINELKGGLPAVGKLITISTPHGGLASAASGVKWSPVVAPSWIDIAKDSEFVKALYEVPLAPTEQYLLFSVLDETADLPSQLDVRAQYPVKGLRGYMEGHVSILEADQVISDVNSILAAPPRGVPRPETTPIGETSETPGANQAGPTDALGPPPAPP